ncbi:expressed unknown protein [Ectocarpus siliculosus]|uniref:Uncharacterized protein n=1 Tax=Ectocarpus siliculosus TaxID=2880 RepID=D7G6M5_ECTSI|nr:expressed unknown protein [Ectocarpus siliculosus]|eukprot:CBJ33964.1 expressed unknown protein [Ectocarpus siliculosus]
MFASLQEVPVKHVVVNKVVDESVKEGYIQRLSKGQRRGWSSWSSLDPDFLRAWCWDVRPGHTGGAFLASLVPQVAKGAAGVSLTLGPYFHVKVPNVYGLRFMGQNLFAPRDKG